MKAAATRIIARSVVSANSVTIRIDNWDYRRSEDNFDGDPVADRTKSYLLYILNMRHIVQIISMKHLVVEAIAPVLMPSASVTVALAAGGVVTSQDDS
jgi:hypothetical protein